MILNDHKPQPLILSHTVRLWLICPFYST
jgi:hypothetical protein